MPECSDCPNGACKLIIYSDAEVEFVTDVEDVKPWKKQRTRNGVITTEVKADGSDFDRPKWNPDNDTKNDWKDEQVEKYNEDQQVEGHECCEDCRCEPSESVRPIEVEGEFTEEATKEDDGWTYHYRIKIKVTRKKSVVEGTCVKEDNTEPVSFIPDNSELIADLPQQEISLGEQRQEQFAKV